MTYQQQSSLTSSGQFRRATVTKLNEDLRPEKLGLVRGVSEAYVAKQKIQMQNLIEIRPNIEEEKNVTPGGDRELLLDKDIEATPRGDLEERAVALIKAELAMMGFSKKMVDALFECE